MDVTAESQGADGAGGADPAGSIVSWHEPRPGRVVLTERNNVDGWIAADLSVALER